MLPKIVGYQGFQSYGDLQYSDLKVGKKTLDSNTVYEKTFRPEDQNSYFENFNYKKSNYHTEQLENIKPSDYQNKEILKKKIQSRSEREPEKRFIDPKYQTHQSKIHEKDYMTSTIAHPFEVQRQSLSGSELQNIPIQTGTEHWSTVYQKQCLQEKDKENGEVQQISAQGQRPQWTYHKAPYTVDIDIGITEYKKKIGTVGLIDLKGNENQYRELVYDTLKDGTTQNTNHLPGYQGYLPHNSTSIHAYQQGLGLQTRNTWLKQNIIENYHTKLPGYAGHLPQSAANNKNVKLRQHCFSLK